MVNWDIFPSHFNGNSPIVWFLANIKVFFFIQVDIGYI